jgi:prepilin-type processing-associated H-X9-DG protein
MQCSNHLKQLALALHTHHDAKGNFPAPGQVNNAGAEYSPFIHLLPFVEQTARFEQISATGFRQNNWYYNPGWAGTLSTLLCPSDSAGRTTAPPVPADWDPTNNDRIAGQGFANGTGWGPPGWPAEGLGAATRNNYAFSQGDACFTVYNWSPTTAGTWNGHPYSLWADNVRAPFTYNKNRLFSDLKDGTSNTIVLSERCAGDGNLRAIKSGTGAFVAGTELIPQTCLNYRGAGNTYKLQSEGGLADSALRGDYNGRRMASCEAFDVWFNTVLPPNSPSCGWGRDNGHYVPPTSYHTGGANIAWGDGSVSFVSDTVDTGTTGLGTVSARMMLNPGLSWRGSQSPYGVWGASGSINGGESLRL